MRLVACEAKEAGVASNQYLVVTMPVDLPASLQASRSVATGLPFEPGVTETTPLFVLYPVAMAVPPAAESVTEEFAE